MDILSDILSQLKLSGTLYFRTSFTSPWSVKVPSFDDVSRFHFAHRGRCLVRINHDEDPVLLDQGDLILITRGASHTLFCDPSTENQAVQLDKVIADSGFTGKGALVYGEQGTNHETQLICGHFAFDKDAKHPLIDALPSYIHVKNYGEAAGNWMESTLKVIGAEAGQDNMGSDLIALKMSEIIYTQLIRNYLESNSHAGTALAGFSDPAIRKVLQAIHQTPQHSWALVELSSIAGLSRTALLNRFINYLGVSPNAYITQWRMQLAQQRLLEANTSMIDVAESVGYQSEAAFGRVFKKHFSIAPAAYRRLQKKKIYDA